MTTKMRSFFMHLFDICFWASFGRQGLLFEGCLRRYRCFQDAIFSIFNEIWSENGSQKGPKTRLKKLRIFGSIFDAFLRTVGPQGRVKAFGHAGHPPGTPPVTPFGHNVIQLLSHTICALSVTWLASWGTESAHFNDSGIILKACVIHIACHSGFLDPQGRLREWVLTQHRLFLEGPSGRTVFLDSSR